jgi:hypothetical protein
LRSQWQRASSAFAASARRDTQCPAINNLGYLPPGATRQTLSSISGPCSFHDHLNIKNDTFRGTIRVE